MGFKELISFKSFEHFQSLPISQSQRAAASSKEKDGRKRTLQETFDETWHGVFQEHCKLRPKSTTQKPGQWTTPAAN